jgi:hypothetical protein
MTRPQTALCSSLLTTAIALLLAGKVTAEETSLEDVAKRLNPVRVLAHSAGEGFAEGTREQADKFVQERIDPLLTRVDAIIAGNIKDAADDAMHLLNQAEHSAKQIIDYGDGKIVKDINVFFEDLDKELEVAFQHIDKSIAKVLCTLAPDGQGIWMKGIPFVRQPDTIWVWRPASNPCFMGFAEAAKHPLWQTFRGFQAYKGRICELKRDLDKLDPADNQTISRMSDYYRLMAGLASQAWCVDEISAPELMTARLTYERQSRFYYDLATGGSPLLYP